MIKPYLADLTESEIHTVMMGGFSTVAGMINLNTNYKIYWCNTNCIYLQKKVVIVIF